MPLVSGCDDVRRGDIIFTFGARVINSFGSNALFLATHTSLVEADSEATAAPSMSDVSARPNEQ